MTDFVETYIDRIKRKNILKKIILFFKNTLVSSEKYTNKGRIHIEIEKNKLERKAKYLILGKFVSRMFKKENVIDFSYKEKFFELNDEIKKIDHYLDKLYKDKNGI
tara:strand:- start:149 stop:466 length:318 start_codon:yes stop_codon:yes gene_type:complete